MNFLTGLSVTAHEPYVLWYQVLSIIDKLIARYERKVEEAARARAGEPLSDGFAVRDFRVDLDMICEEISTAR